MNISNEELEKRIATGNTNRITKEYIESKIVKEKYTLFEETNLTHCIIFLDNGFKATGESQCVDMANFKKDVGRKISHDRAFDKLWEPFGFNLCENNFLNKQ